jgi:DNA polymerase III delta prime subunit
MLKNTLWVEKYRPTTLDQYVGSDVLKNTFNEYLNSKDIPHLLLHGSAGGGKTTLAKIVANTIADGNYLYINASDENSVDTVRDKIKQFASTIGFGGLKIVILDEADFTTPNFQAALRNVMETFSKNTRFILTCNYKDKIIEPIHSRCQTFFISPPSKKDIALMAKNILDAEGIEYDNKSLASVINLTFPDIRKIINTLQQSSVGKTLNVIDAELMNNDLNISIVNLLLDSKIKNGVDKFNKIRQLVADNLVRDFNPLYRFIYDSIDKFPKENRFLVLATIADAQYKDAFVVDHEINAMNALYTIITELK